MCLLLAMFIGEDWMINLMIIYIKKIIANVLDFNDIIKKNYGDVNSIIPNLSMNN
jgi:hypothetical protein